MDPQTPYGSAGQTAQERQVQLAQQQAGLNELTRQFDGLQQKASPQAWISYKDRWRASGEEAAARWFVQKYGGH